MQRRSAFAGAMGLFFGAILPAQSTGSPWPEYRPADSSFAVRFPVRNPMASQHMVSPAVSDASWSVSHGPMLLMAEVFESDEYTRGTPDAVYALLKSGTAGAVFHDSVVNVGAFTGRWGRIDDPGDGARQPSVKEYRAFLIGRRLLVVRATAFTGQPFIPAESRYLVESFTPCSRGSACAAPVPSGPAPGLSGIATPAEGAPYFEFQVLKRVTVVPGSPYPRYPEVLRTAKLDGSVLVEFVVDTLGVPEMPSFKVLRSTHDLFSQAVRAALPEMRFTPAEVPSGRVRQLVQMPFQFSFTP